MQGIIQHPSFFFFLLLFFWTLNSLSFDSALTRIHLLFAGIDSGHFALLYVACLLIMVFLFLAFFGVCGFVELCLWLHYTSLVLRLETFVGVGRFCSGNWWCNSIKKRESLGIWGWGLAAMVVLSVNFG